MGTMPSFNDTIRTSAVVKGCWTPAVGEVCPFNTASWGRCLKSPEVGNRGVVVMRYGDSRSGLVCDPIALR